MVASRASLEVSDVRFVPARRDTVSGGMLGWASFVLGGAVRLDSVSVRRQTDGSYSLSYPCRRSRLGENHPFIAPLDESVRAAIEAQVLREIRRQGAAL